MTQRFVLFAFCLLLAVSSMGRVYFIPGLGYQKEKPSPYVLGIESDLEAAGISYLTVSGSNPGNTGSPFRDRIPDMIFVKEYGQKPSSSLENNIRIIKVATLIAKDLDEHPLAPGEQVNILGTSQGAVSVAQAVYFLLKYPEDFGLEKNFKINHLVLAGCPVHLRSKLYRSLKKYEREKKIDTILYKNYQSINKRGRMNDQVTGLSGKWQFGAVLRGVIFLFDALLVRKSKHPHVMASENKPTMPGFATFGEQIVSQLVKDGIN